MVRLPLDRGLLGGLRGCPWKGVTKPSGECLDSNLRVSASVMSAMVLDLHRGQTHPVVEALPHLLWHLALELPPQAWDTGCGTHSGKPLRTGVLDLRSRLGATGHWGSEVHIPAGLGSVGMGPIGAA